MCHSQRTDAACAVGLLPIRSIKPGVLCDDCQLIELVHLQPQDGWQGHIGGSIRQKKAPRVGVPLDSNTVCGHRPSGGNDEGSGIGFAADVEAGACGSNCTGWADCACRRCVLLQVPVLSIQRCLQSLVYLLTVMA